MQAGTVSFGGNVGAFAGVKKNGPASGSKVVHFAGKSGQPTGAAKRSKGAGLIGTLATICGVCALGCVGVLAVGILALRALWKNTIGRITR